MLIKQALLTAILAIGMGCSSSNAQQTTQRAEEPIEFPYPEIPTMLTDTEARLAYMCEHFWDKFNFNDSTETYRSMGEQGLADFINLNLQADASVNERAGKALADHLWEGFDRIQDPRVKVLAVYPDNDLDLWKNHRLDFKEGWTDSYSPNGEIGHKQLYFIQATPSLYLLDKDKRVILKDASLNDIMNMLRALP